MVLLVGEKESEMSFFSTFDKQHRKKHKYDKERKKKDKK